MGHKVKLANPETPMRTRFAFIVAAVLALIVAPASAGQLRDDGIHYQPWIKVSFLDINEDVKEAVAKGKKGLVIIYEKKGCGSCKQLHEVNFADKDLVAYITDNFDVIQINIFGDNEVTAPDGTVMREADFAESNLVNFSPTTQIITANGQEAFRMPGFMKLPFYKRGFQYVVDGHAEKGLSFQRFLQTFVKQPKSS
jgi:thioredoxin-related protein